MEIVYTKKYRKALVCVKMGLKQEKEISEDLIIFRCNQKQQLIQAVIDSFRKCGKCLVLKVSKLDYQHSPRIYIDEERELQQFFDFGINELFEKYQEAWLIKRATTVQWKCRIIISTDADIPEIIEIIYCDNDHGLDKFSINENKHPYARYMKESHQKVFECVTMQNNTAEVDIDKVAKHIILEMAKIKSKVDGIRNDLGLMDLPFVSIDFRVLDNGRLNFHDWDAPNYEKVLDYYVPVE